MDQRVSNSRGFDPGISGVVSVQTSEEVVFFPSVLVSSFFCVEFCSP